MPYNNEIIAAKYLIVAMAKHFGLCYINSANLHKRRDGVA